jgi:hypothetical protein
MELVIDRKIWLRGEGTSKSYLQRLSDGKRCCVGTFCIAAGIPPKRIIGCSAISLFNKIGQSLAVNFQTVDAQVTFNRLYVINDTPVGDECPFLAPNERMTEEKREELIKTEFAKLGVNVTFIN